MLGERPASGVTWRQKPEHVEATTLRDNSQCCTMQIPTYAVRSSVREFDAYHISQAVRDLMIWRLINEEHSCISVAAITTGKDSLCRGVKTAVVR